MKTTIIIVGLILTGCQSFREVRVVHDQVIFEINCEGNIFVDHLMFGAELQKLTVAECNNLEIKRITPAIDRQE